MKFLLKFSCLFLLVIFFATRCEAEQLLPQNSANLSVQIEQASLRMRKRTSSKSAKNDSPLLLIKLTAKNVSENQKLNFSGPFQAELKDNFGNTYRQLECPAEESCAPAFLPNDSFPSLYPQETIEQNFIFEPPINGMVFLNLFVKSQPEENFKNVLILRADEIKDYTIPGPRDPNERDINILHPQEGTALRPGQYFYLRLGLSGDVKMPEAIKIITPNYTLKDGTVGLSYRIRVPKDFKKDNYIVVVIAQWGAEFKRQLISKTLTLKISDPHDECKENCLARIE